MDKFTLIIGNKNYSSWSLRPWILMKQAKIPFEEILIPLFQDAHKEKILKYSPAGKVPTLIHGKITVWESLAICEYLSDIFPEKNFWPKDKEKRAWARAIANEMHAGFQALRSNCPMDARAMGKKPKATPPDFFQNIERIKTIWEGCRRAHKKGGEFLFGNFTIADAMYAPIVFRFNSYGMETSDEAKEYFETMLHLPAMQEWLDAGKKEPWTIDH